MINFTIKTLESVNHQFSVEDDTTVAQLKERIRVEMGIEINMQRLIFCGRVLTDEQLLSEFGVNGKVIHLVPRPPPSPHSRASSYNPRQEMREAIAEAQRFIEQLPTPHTSRQGPVRNSWAVDPPSELVQDQQQEALMSPVANRLDFMRRAVHDIRSSLQMLEQLQEESNIAMAMAEEQMDAESSSPDSDNQSSSDARPADMPSTSHHDQESNMEPESASEHGNDSYPPEAEVVPRPLRPGRPILTLPRDLAALLEELEQLREQFAPHRAAFLRFLRDTNTQYLSPSETSRRRTLVEQCCDVMHSFAHAFHAASDIDVTIGSVTRLTTGFLASTHAIPVQTHVNLFNAGRRWEGPPANSSQTPNRPERSFTRVRAQRINPGANPTPGTSGSADGQDQGQGGNVAGTNTTNPESITYQVEIETRVPIALPIDADFLLNNLAVVTTDARGRRQDQGQGQSQGARGQAQAQAQGQGQSQPQLLINQASAQPVRPRALTDIETLLRTLSHAHPGVEVVMSMEEIPPLGTLTQATAGEFTAAFGGRGNAPFGTATVSGATFAPFGFPPGPSTSDNGANANQATETGATGQTATTAGTSGGAEGTPSPSPSGRGELRFGAFTPRLGIPGLGAAVTLGPEIPLHADPADYTVEADGAVYVSPVNGTTVTTGESGEIMLHNMFSSLLQRAGDPNDPNARNAAANNATVTTRAATCPRTRLTWWARPSATPTCRSPPASTASLALSTASPTRRC